MYERGQATNVIATQRRRTTLHAFVKRKWCGNLSFGSILCELKKYYLFRNHNSVCELFTWVTFQFICKSFVSFPIVFFQTIFRPNVLIFAASVNKSLVYWLDYSLHGLKGIGLNLFAYQNSRWCSFILLKRGLMARPGRMWPAKHLHVALEHF